MKTDAMGLPQGYTCRVYFTVVSERGSSGHLGLFSELLRACYWLMAHLKCIEKVNVVFYLASSPHEGLLEISSYWIFQLTLDNSKAKEVYYIPM